MGTGFPFPGREPVCALFWPRASLEPDIIARISPLSGLAQTVKGGNGDSVRMAWEPVPLAKYRHPVTLCYQDNFRFTDDTRNMAAPAGGRE